jgi:dTDP-4-dehydrorhamnose reductase
MKVSILGDGKLGSSLNLLTNWPIFSRKLGNFDITNPSNVSDLQNYDIIVNCIAYTDTYSSNFNDNWEVNVNFVSNLIDLCNSRSQKLVHISTDYVYAGSVSNASENDVPVHIPTWYGYTKLVGDALVQLKSNDYLICRLSHKPYPFPYPRAWDDVFTCGDYLPIITTLVANLIKTNESGVFNVGTEPKSIYELSQKTQKTEPIKSPIEVPKDTTMNIDKLKSILKY